MRNEDLYMNLSGEKIKFIGKGLKKISDFIDYNGGELWVKVKNRRYKISPS